MRGRRAERKAFFEIFLSFHCQNVIV
jgi:hypothetical protein